MSFWYLPKNMASKWVEALLASVLGIGGASSYAAPLDDLRKKSAKKLAALALKKYAMSKLTGQSTMVQMLSVFFAWLIGSGC